MIDRYVALLYTLARDHLPTGRIESIVQEIEQHPGKTLTFSSGGLEFVAREWCYRLGISAESPDSGKLARLGDLLMVASGAPGWLAGETFPG